MGVAVSKERFHEEKLKARALDSRLKVRERSAAEAKAQAEALQASVAALEEESDASQREAERRVQQLEKEVAEAAAGRDEEAIRGLALKEQLAERDAECLRLGAALGEAVGRAEKLEAALERMHSEIRDVQARAKTLAEEKEQLMAEASGSIASFAVREGGFDSPPRRASSERAARSGADRAGSLGSASHRVALDAHWERTPAEGRHVAFARAQSGGAMSREDDKRGQRGADRGGREVHATPEDEVGPAAPHMDDVTPVTPGPRDRSTSRVAKGATQRTPLTPASALIAQVVSFDSTSESEGHEDEGHEPPHSYAEAVSRPFSGKSSPDNVPAAQPTRPGASKARPSATDYAEAAKRMLDETLAQREGNGSSI